MANTRFLRLKIPRKKGHNLFTGKYKKDVKKNLLNLLLNKPIYLKRNPVSGNTANKEINVFIRLFNNAVSNRVKNDVKGPSFSYTDA
jgi:hypothetical protein